MIRPLLLLSAPAFALAACGTDSTEDAPTPDAPAATASPAPSAAASPPPHLAPDDPPPPAPKPLAAALTRAEWRKSDDPGACAPLAFTSDGGAPATARRANFSGGWGVAFDTPQVRSAYGVAGVGALDSDADPPASHERRLRDQWPHFTRLTQLPAPSFAGYGIEGGAPYPADNPDGRGVQSVAYVRVAGQACDYNVWSRLGRAHLEVLLDSLRRL